MKLEIALAIPASNDEKYNIMYYIIIIYAAQGLNFNMTAYPSCHMTLSSYIMYPCDVAFQPEELFLVQRRCSHLI